MKEVYKITVFVQNKQKEERRIGDWKTFRTLYGWKDMFKANQTANQSIGVDTLVDSLPENAPKTKRATRAKPALITRDKFINNPVFPNGERASQGPHINNHP